MSKQANLPKPNVDEHEMENEENHRAHSSSNSHDDENHESGDEKRQFNKFELLDLVGGEEESAADPDDETSSDISGGNNADGHERSKHNGLTNAGSSKAANKRKPRNKRRKNRLTSKQTAKGVDELDDELADLARAINTRSEPDESQEVNYKYKLLKVEMRNLVPEAELKRIFGKGVVKEDKSRQRIYPGINLQRSRFISGYFDTKSSGPISGPKMELDETINNVRNNTWGQTTGGANTSAPSSSSSSSSAFVNSDRPIYFKFVHDKSYQEAQRMFLEAVNRANFEFIAQNLDLPFFFHAESLVQLSHQFRVSEDYKTASELIERALVVFERGFHPRFNLATATCRLSYKRPENRTFFIVIFKHINCCHRRGLRRTPFEYTKLLLSLEPDNDPLMAIQLLDFFAIRCEEYDYLIEFHTRWEQSQKLPNLSFSLALAHFLKSRCTKQSKVENDANLKLADEQLQKSLLLFPNFIIPLLDACSAEPDSELKKCAYFDYSAYSTKYKLVPETVDVLVNLYVERTFSLWKQKPVLAWLERNVAEMVSKFATSVLVDEGKHMEHWSKFTKVAPKILLRHIVLCDLKINVPSSASSSTYIDIDPYPPTDSIVTYDTSLYRTNQRSDSGGYAGGSLFEEVSGLFLRSILPSFSLSGQEANTATSSGPSQPVNQPRNRPVQRPNSARNQTRAVVAAADAAEAFEELQIIGANVNQSNGLVRERAEDLLTIIRGIRDLHGLSIEDIPPEAAVDSTGNSQPSVPGRNDRHHDRTGDDDENELRRRPRPQ